MICVTEVPQSGPDRNCVDRACGAPIGCAGNGAKPSGHDRNRKTYQAVANDASGASHRPRDRHRARRRRRSRPRAAEGTARRPRRGNRAVAQRIYATDPAGGGACPTERAGRHHQRSFVQCLRRRRPPHLRQRWRIDGGRDAESDHRRAGARERPHRRRTSVAHARRDRLRDDAIDHRHAPRRRRAGCRQPQWRRRPRASRHGRLGRAVDGDPKYDVRLHARPGGAGRPRRRKVPHRDRAVPQRHVRDLQADGRISLSIKCAT